MEEVINPFRSLRLNAGLTLGEVSTYSRMDIRAISRAEYAMYTNPPPGLVDYWVRRGAISEGVLVTEYEDYQTAIRRHNHRCLGNGLAFNGDLPIHPLRQLRKRHGFKLIELCKALCVPLDTVQYFEKKWRLQQSVPKGFLNALNQAGYSRLELREFQDAYSLWRQSQNRVRFS